MSENVSDKADKVASATSGNLAALDANGNLADSGYSPSDFQAALPSITDNAGKVLTVNSAGTGLEWTTIPELVLYDDEEL